jgi:hypothetical protein
MRNPSSRWARIAANRVYKKARNRELYYVRMALPSIVILLIFVTDFIWGSATGKYSNAHVTTYVVFGVASLFGAAVSILIILRLGRSYKDVEEVRTIFFDVVEDVSKEQEAFILLAAPNPGQHNYKKKVTNPETYYIQDFNKIVDRVRKKGLPENSNPADQKPIIHIACLPWVRGADDNGKVWSDNQLKNRDASKIDTNEFEESPMGEFIREFYDYHSKEDEFGWGGYCGNVISFLKSLQAFSADNIIEIFWLTDNEVITNPTNMIIMLKSEAYAYFGTYDYLRFQFDILDIREQRKSAEDVFNMLLQLYDAKPLLFKNDSSTPIK